MQNFQVLLHKVVKNIHSSAKHRNPTASTENIQTDTHSGIDSTWQEQN